jgi:GTPase SAR1 family protein
LNSFELKNFRVRKERIVYQLRLLAGIADELSAHSIAEEVERTLSDLKEETFRFVVVGEFSRGKSTFINALLGNRLLPSSVEPTTAVLTRIRNGPESRLYVSFRCGGRTEEISYERFQSLIAPPEPHIRDKEKRREYEGRLNELRRIAMVDIQCSSGILQEGIEIVDTPGTNDLDPLREQITYDYIPRADAILFVLSAKQPLTRTECDFLRDRVLRSDVARIFFILNFADTLSHSDLEVVRNLCLSELASIVGTPRLYLVSAKKTLLSRTGRIAIIEHDQQARFEDLERALASFLETERATAKLSRPICRGARICDELLAGPIGIAKSALNLGIPELQNRIDALAPKVRTIQERRARAVASLHIRLENRRIALEYRMREGLYRVANAALIAVDTYDGPLNQEELGRHIESRVAPLQSDFQVSFKEEATSAFSKEFQALESSLSDSVNLDTLIGFSASSSLTSSTIEPHELGNGGWTLFQIGGAGLGFLLLPFFAPLAILAGWVGGVFAAGFLQEGARKEQLGKVRNAVDERYRGNITDSVERFRNAWKQAEESALKSLDDDSDRRCRDARSALEAALADLTAATSTAAQRAVELDTLTCRVQAVKRSLLDEGSSSELHMHQESIA